jgi:hypothetical protein
VMETCDAILAAIDDSENPSTITALVICMVVLAHEEELDKAQTIKTISERIEEDWTIFTRLQVEESIRKLHQAGRERLRWAEKARIEND